MNLFSIILALTSLSKVHPRYSAPEHATVFDAEKAPVDFDALQSLLSCLHGTWREVEQIDLAYDGMRTSQVGEM